MAKPVIAPNDVELIKKAILAVLQGMSGDRVLNQKELRELEIIYHRLGRIEGD